MFTPLTAENLTQKLLYLEPVTIQNAIQYLIIILVPWYFKEDINSFKILQVFSILKDMSYTVLNNYIGAMVFKENINSFMILQVFSILKNMHFTHVF